MTALTTRRGTGIIAAGYVALLALSAWLLADDRFGDSGWRFAIALLPVPPAAALVMAGIARYRRMDELQQRVHLIALAAAFLGTILTVFSWGFLESVGVPRLGGFAVFAVLNAYYLAGLVWARRRYR